MSERMTGLPAAAARSLAELRAQRPLVHAFGNLVSMNDCANLLLCCGARPIMAQDEAEAAEITLGCRALALSLGTPSAQKLHAQRLSAEAAGRADIPVVFDPVGVSASGLRREGARTLLQEATIRLIRGNASEILALSVLLGCMPDVSKSAPAFSGVDTAGTDADEMLTAARALARRTGAAVIVSGETDHITDGDALLRLSGGSPMLPSLTGAGCMLTVLAAAFCAVQPDPFIAAAAACGMMKCCAQRAAEHAAGPGTLRAALLDEIYRFAPDQLEGVLKLEV